MRSDEELPSSSEPEDSVGHESSDYEPEIDGAEEEAIQADHVEEQRLFGAGGGGAAAGGGRRGSSGGRGRGGGRSGAGSETGGDDDDYERSDADGFATGADTEMDDDYDDLFASGARNPLDLLGCMEESQLQQPDGACLEPYELLRRFRGQAAAAATAAAPAARRPPHALSALAAVASAAGGAALDHDMDGDGDDGAGGGGGGGGADFDEQGGPGGGGVFGADVDEIWDRGESELDGPRSSRKKSRRRKAGTGAGLRFVMPEEVSQKLGQANLHYAKSRYPEAAELLMEVIKQCPQVVDAYQTLGLLHSAMGNERRALEFYVIAAHLTPKDTAIWKRLAQMSTQQKFFKQAIYCLTKAISRDKNDHDARWDRALLYAETRDHLRALQQAQQVLKVRPDDLQLVQFLARIHHRMGNPSKAIQVLEEHIEKHPGAPDLTTVNMLAELLMDVGSNGEALSTIEGAAAWFMNDDNTEPAALPIDLTVKAGICTARLNRLDESDEHLAQLLAEDPADYGDLYSVVGNALLGMGQPARALKFLLPLLTQPAQEGPPLWESLLDCYRRLGRLQDGVDLYQQHITSQPEQEEALLRLAEACLEVGGLKPAQAAAERWEMLYGQSLAELGGSAEQALAQLATYLRGKRLLLQVGRSEAFISAVLPLIEDALGQLEYDIRLFNDPGINPMLHRAINRRRMALKRDGAKGMGTGEDHSVFRGVSRKEKRKQAAKKLDKAADEYLSGYESQGDQAYRRGQDSSAAADAPRVSSLMGRLLFVEAGHMDTFMQLCRALMDNGRVADGRRLLGRALELCNQQRRWFDDAKRDVLRLGLVDATCRAGDHSTASTLLKSVCMKYGYSTGVCAALCRANASSGGSLRNWMNNALSQRRRHCTSVPLMIMSGHVLSLRHLYDDALSEYFHAYRFVPQEPIVLLCIGTTYLNYAMSRSCPDRHLAVLRGFAFLQEYELQRGLTQEVLYNMGRAAHQLGLAHLALTYYERALQAPRPSLPSASRIQQDPPPVPEAAMDLTREIAHNLAQLYRASGATELARRLYRTHLAVV